MKDLIVLLILNVIGKNSSEKCVISGEFAEHYTLLEWTPLRVALLALFSAMSPLAFVTAATHLEYETIIMIMY